MSPLDSAGAASAFARGTPTTQTAFSARGGGEKAQIAQSSTTANAAAPIESSAAVIQAQAAQAARMASEQRPVARVPQESVTERANKAATAATSVEVRVKTAQKPNPSLAKPMTAVILHELRLQQELADVQEEKERKAR